MRDNLNMIAALAAVSLMAACGGGAPAGFFDNSPEPGLSNLDYDLTSSTDSGVDAADVEGYKVDLTHPNYQSADDKLPSGFRAVFGVLLNPDTNVGGFEGSLSVRPGKVGSALLSGGKGSLFHVMPGDGSVVKCGAVLEGGDGSLNVADLSALGLLIFAEQTGPDFVISAFADMSVAQAGTEVHFWALAKGGDAPIKYGWTFGDGGSAAGDSVSHTYPTPGIYNVSVVGEDANGVQSPSAGTPIEITASPNPITGVTITGPVQQPNEPLSFSYGATAQGGTPPLSYSWDFDGDGSADDTSGALVTFTFAAPGFYVGSVTVTDSLGSSASAEVVTDARSLSLSGNPLSDETPLTVNFTLQSEGTDASDAISIDFDDGQTLQNPGSTFDHTYVLAGTYSAVASAERIHNGVSYLVSSKPVECVALSSPGAPFLQLTQPVAGPAGAVGDVTFTAYGYNLGPEQGSRRLMLGGVEITPDSWGQNSIVFTLPSSTPVDDLTIEWSGGVSNLLRIDAGSGDPIIGNVIPLDNTPPNFMLIIGRGFGDAEGSVTINGVPMTVQGWSDGGILTRTPGGLATGQVDVVVSPVSGVPVAPFATRLELSVPAGPSLDSVSGSSTFGSGPALTLTGSGFGSADGSLVFSNGIVIPATWTNSQAVLADSPVPIDTWCVVINRNSVSNPLDIFDSVPPEITSISPPDAYEGLEIQIAGLHFGAVQAVGTVEMNGFTLAVTSWSDTLITAILPTGITDGDVIIHRYLDSAPFALNIIPRPPGKPNPGQI
jgi:PKD repeat protein